VRSIPDQMMWSPRIIQGFRVKAEERDIVVLNDPLSHDRPRVCEEMTRRSRRKDWWTFMLHDVNPIQKNDRIEVSRLFLELAQTHRAEILVTCLSNHGAGVVWME